jgi:gliding motility-associated-like protein
VSASGSITVTPNNTITLTSAAATTNQTVCINTAITNITYSTTGATGATFAGLPAGVTGNWAAGVATVSGTPTASGTFNYTVNLTGGCGTVSASGTITVTPDNTITLTSAAATTNQTVCINTAITNVTYSTTGATGATFAGLPAGVTGNWAAGVATVSGTPTASGTFNYTVNLTGGCGTVSASGSIAVTPNNTVTRTSAVGTDNQTLCINTAIANITYSTTGATGATFAGLPAGVTGNWAAGVATISGTPTASGTFNYTVNLTGGCGTVSASGTITVNPLNPVTVSITADDSDVCSGTTVNFTATPVNGGLTPSYQWKVNGTNSGLDQNTYSLIPVNGDIVEVVLTSSATCISGSPATSNQITMVVNSIPAAPSIGTVTNTTCTTATGSIELTGLPAGNWTVNPGAVAGSTPTTTISGLVPGTYSFTVTSAAGCISPASANAVIDPQPASPVLVITNPAPVCAPGTADITAASVTTGSTAGITLTYWSDAAATVAYLTPATAGAGTYYIKGTAVNGCFDIDPVVVTVRPLPTLSSTQVNVSCFGTLTGSINLTAATGTAPYTYVWTGTGVAPTAEDQTGLAAGVYSVVATDFNGCVSLPHSVTITEPAVLTGSVSSQTDVSAFGGNDGSVTVAGAGGTAPYQYSLNGGTYQASGTFGSLAAAAYVVTVRDANLCTANVNVTIAQPAPTLTGSITSQTNVTCFGTSTGSVTVSGTGGTTPYQYKLGSGSYQASATFGSLAAGTYVVTIRDAASVTFDINVTITQPASAVQGAIATITNVTCKGGTNGSVTITGSGGTGPYLYKLDAGTFQASGTFSGLAAGSYSITVQDASLCTAVIPVSVTEPAQIGMTFSSVPVSCPNIADGSVTLTPTGGTQPYTALWSDGGTGLLRNSLPSGSYGVNITDLNGCNASFTVEVGFSNNPGCIEIQEIITPNNDGYYDTWRIRNIEIYPDAEVHVFNRWGKKVFSTKNISANEWNGTYKGKLLPTDSYHFVLYLKKGADPISGTVTIVR